MIESAAECLNKGGRRSLRFFRKPLCTQRDLHSAFWSHGAGEINLPAWWLMLLRTPQEKEEKKKKKKKNWVNKRLAAAQTIFSCMSGADFLDYLYPSQTLSIVRQILDGNKVRWSRRQQTRHTPSPLRAYSSIASDLTNATGDVEGTTTSADSLQTAKVKTPLLKPQLQYLAHRKEVDSALDDLFNSPGEGPDHEKIWHYYLNIRNLSEDLTDLQLTQTLRYLNTARTLSSSKRVMFLVNKIPAAERNSFHFRQGIKAALTRGDTLSAMKYHRQSLQRSRCAKGTSLMIRYMLEHEDWAYAEETVQDYYHEYCLSKGIDPQNHPMGKILRCHPIWTNVCFMPLPILFEKAAAIAEYAIKSAARNAAIEATHAQQLALEVITRAFSVDANELDIDAHRKLFNLARLLRRAVKVPASSMYRYAIRQLLRTRIQKYKRIAITYYRKVRKVEWKPHGKSLHVLLTVFWAEQDRAGIFEVIEDFRNYYGDIPRRKIPLMIATLAGQGDAESVQGLFKEYVERSGKLIPAIFNFLLHVHFRRVEPHQADECFRDFQREYQFQPNLQSWNTMIATHARAGDVEGAISWFNQLIADGKRPDAFSYASLMSMFAKRGDLEAVGRHFSQSKADGILSTVYMINSLVLVLIKNNRLDDAMKLAEEALQMKFDQPRTVMWNHLLKAHAEVGDLAGIAETYKRMGEAAVPDNASTFSALLHGLVAKKQPDPAEKLLQDIIPTAGIQPDPMHYALVLKGFFNVGLHKRVLKLYCSMLEKKVMPTQGTQIVLLRSVAALETRRKSGVEPPKELLRTQAVFQQILANMDSAELAANRPIPFVGANLIKEAFTSTTFRSMISIYGERAAFEKVQELYDQYIDTARKFQGPVDFIPPIEMLGALISVKTKARDNGEADRFWQLAVKKAMDLARPFYLVSDTPWRALYSRRFILSPVLPIYLRCLELQRKIDQVVSTVNQLTGLGFEFYNATWNAYVQILARKGQEKLAFSVCEQELMGEWRGWESLGRRARMMRRFRRIRPDGVRPVKRFPDYRTLVLLAAAHQRIRFNGTKEAVKELARVGPKTAHAVVTMPHIKDRFQGRYLRKYGLIMH